MARPEHEFPTIRDLRDGLANLVERGLGDHPVQIVVVPASTMLVIARATGAPAADEPPLMIEFCIADSAGRIPPTFVSTSFIEGKQS